MVKPTRFTSEIVEEYISKGYWNHEESVSDIWLRNARNIPDREAIVDSRHRLTWEQVGKWIERLAYSFLDLGLKKGDVIVTQLPNSAELAVIRNACELAGLLCLPALTTLRHSELEHIFSVTRPSGMVIPWKFRDFDYFQMVKELLPSVTSLNHIIVVGDNAPPGILSFKDMVEKPLEAVYPRERLEKAKCRGLEVSLLLHTTGTTGLPKIVEFPVCTMVYSAKVHIPTFNLTSGDILGVFGPAPAGANSLAYLGIPNVGGKVIMVERFEAGEALRLIEKERITIACVVPALLAMMVKHPDFPKYDLSSLRCIDSFGAFLDYALAVEAEGKFGCPVAQTYGSNDSGPLCIAAPDDPQEIRLRTVGKPRGGGEVKLIDDNGKEVGQGEIGEVMDRGPILASGFYRDEAATWQVWTRDGWFKTGDLGRFDARGNLMIAGRKKDMIIRGGQNIYPVEVEGLIATHPGVSAVAIVGMPDPVMGEKACAYVVPKPGQIVRLEEIISYLKTKNIASYKLPERLEIIDALPIVGEQKVDKKALQQDILKKIKDKR